MGWRRDRRRGGFSLAGQRWLPTRPRPLLPALPLPFLRQRLQRGLLDHGRIDVQICDTTRHSEVRCALACGISAAANGQCMRAFMGEWGRARTGSFTCPGPLNRPCRRGCLQNRPSTNCPLVIHALSRTDFCLFVKKTSYRIVVGLPTRRRACTTRL